MDVGESRELELTIAGEAAAVGPAVEPPPGGDAPPPGGDPGGTTPAAGSSFRTVGMIASGAVAVIGLGVGIGFYMAKQSAKDDADGYKADAVKQVGPNGCWDQPSAGPCRDLADANDRAKSNGTISTIGFVGAGVGAAGYVAFMLLMPRSKSATALHPLLDQHTAGLGASGRF